MLDVLGSHRWRVANACSYRQRAARAGSHDLQTRALDRNQTPLHTCSVLHPWLMARARAKSKRGNWAFVASPMLRLNSAPWYLPRCRRRLPRLRLGGDFFLDVTRMACVGSVANEKQLPASTYLREPPGTTVRDARTRSTSGSRAMTWGRSRVALSSRVGSLGSRCVMAATGVRVGMPGNTVTGLPPARG